MPVVVVIEPFDVPKTLSLWEVMFDTGCSCGWYRFYYSGVRICSAIGPTAVGAAKVKERWSLSFATGLAHLWMSRRSRSGDRALAADSADGLRRGKRGETCCFLMLLTFANKWPQATSSTAL